MAYKRSTALAYFVALGCPKNQVDTERMIGLTQRLGLGLASQPEDADIIVVNTCSFILPAREESIETILELAEYKKTRCSLLVVTGCLAQRYAGELARELPEVDHFIGTADWPRLETILGRQSSRRIMVGAPGDLTEELYPRTPTGPAHWAYLKIAEGCDRQCAFCIIPQLRGKQRSRALPSLITEAEQLVSAGARELILVAQDTTSYGRDLTPSRTLIQLLQALDTLEGLHWIRLLYTYPSAVNDRLVQALARLRHLAPYLDLPFQHIDDRVLQRMGRGYKGHHVRNAVSRLRQTLPNAFLRGTVITGHPGETPVAYQALSAFIAEAQLDHLGVFPFSAEEGTAAAQLPDPVPLALAKKRTRSLMAAQRKISRAKLRQLVGQVLEVIVDGPSEESEYLMEGRHAGQAPEIDGVVILTDCTSRPGSLVKAQVTEASDYDLVARTLETE